MNFALDFFALDLGSLRIDKADFRNHRPLGPDDFLSSPSMFVISQIS